MKTLYFWIGTMVCLSAFGQAPEHYYDFATNKTGKELKLALYDIIKNHKTYRYSSSSTDTWDILKEADRDPGNPQNVILIYTGQSVNAAQEYNSGSGWNREHVWAKSRGDFGTAEGPGTDCHALKAANISLNSTRNNRFFADGEESVMYKNAPTGNYLGAATYVFEPRDEIKGDVARMIFYMATRYEGENGEPDLQMTDNILSKTDKSPYHGKLSVLLKWHQNDPVDDFERNRNNVVYKYQGNRNPFIDHPEFVAAIWQNNTSTQTATSQNTFAITCKGNICQVTGSETIEHIEVKNMGGSTIAEHTNSGNTSTRLQLPSTGVYLVLINNCYVQKIVSL